jgi:hypothetical protein
VPKNIALFVDGTKNKPYASGSAKNSNVRRLFEAAKAAHQPPDQLAYMWGIGRGRTAESVPGGEVRYGGSERFTFGITGLGMAARVRWAYKFLSKNYDRDDRTYLFGFSRGAFGARSIAGFAGAIGLLLKDAADDKIEQAWRIYETYDPAQPNAALDRLREYLRPIIPPRLQPVPNADDGTVLPIHLIAVWDTVAALGLPGLLRLLTADRTKFHQTDLPEHITHARHALALHELRQDFEPLLWPGTHPNATDQTLEQVWFVGAHSNVGGSEPAGASWADIPLQWIAQEALRLKLPLAGLPFPSGPSVPSDQIANSRSGPFTFADYGVRPQLEHWQKLEARTIATIDVDQSVLTRLSDPARPAYSFDHQYLDRDLGIVDDVSLQLLLARQLRLTPSAGLSDWWTTVSAADLTSMENRLAAVLKAAVSSDHLEQCTLSVSVNVICHGPAALTRVVEIAKASAGAAPAFLHTRKFDEVDRIQDGLGVLRDVLERCASRVPAPDVPLLQRALNDIGHELAHVQQQVLKAKKP